MKLRRICPAGPPEGTSPKGCKPAPKGLCKPPRRGPRREPKIKPRRGVTHRST